MSGGRICGLVGRLGERMDDSTVYIEMPDALVPIPAALQSRALATDVEGGQHRALPVGFARDRRIPLTKWCPALDPRPAIECSSPGALLFYRKNLKCRPEPRARTKINRDPGKHRELASHSQ